MQITGCAGSGASSETTTSSSSSAVQSAAPEQFTTSEEQKEPAPFVGLEKTELITGNIGLNSKSYHIGDFFCCVGENIFFTDFTDNSSLCALKNGKKELLVSKPSCHINYYDGKVYFLSSETTPVSDLSFSGSIYCFDTENGTCELLADVPAADLYVTQEGIFFDQVMESTSNSIITHQMFMDFNGEITPCDYSFLFRYGKYAITGSEAIDTSESITSPSQDSIIPFEMKNSLMDKTCLNGDYLITYSPKFGFEFLNLSDGEYFGIDKEILSGLFIDGSVYVEDYTVISDTLYVSCCSNSIIEINMKTMEAELYYVDGANSMLVNNLYTDGKQLYGTLCAMSLEPSKTVLFKKGERDYSFTELS